MKQRMKFTTMFSIAVTLVFLISLSVVEISVYAQDGGGETDTFDSATLENWETTQDVIVSDGVLKISPGSFAFKLGDWQEVSLQLKMRFSASSEVLIHYYASDKGAYGLHVMGDSVWLEKVYQETPTELGNAQNISVPEKEWVTINVEFKNGQHKISVDQETVLTVDDAEPLPAGAVGMVVIGESAVEFDDFTVSGQRGEPLPMEEPIPGEGEDPGEPVPLMEQDPAQQQAAPLVSADSSMPSQTTSVQNSSGTLSLLDELYGSQPDDIQLVTFLINLLLAGLTSFILSLVYIHWGASLSNRRKFASNFMLVTVTTTFIILVVRSSIALSLGLVGALSIIRFRTAVKEPEELAYLFFAIGLGIGFGDNQRLVTLLSLGVGIVILGLLRVFRRSRADVNLYLSITSKGSQKVTVEQIIEVLEKYTSKWKLIRLDENPTMIEMSYLLEFKKLTNLNQAREAIKILSPSVEISFMDNKGIE